MDVRAVVRTLEILEALEKDVQGLSELSRRLSLSKATLLRFLNTLINHGYVDYDPKTQKYDLGTRVLKLGMKVSERYDLKRIAAPYLERVWHDCEETVYLNIRNGYERLCIDCMNGKKEVRVVSYIGHSSPLHVAASGKAILAFLDPAEIDDYLSKVEFEKVAPGTITDPELLRSNLEKIREMGYATSFEERLADAIGASAPIRDITGRVIASVSITAPSNRTEKDHQHYIDLVTEAAGEISKKLGYSH
ncbi:MAG: IclR family transcriptional regulator [Firmicutes bacterium]|nr:IclR family transcriptional regulator [Bacillota bacterium]